LKLILEIVDLPVGYLKDKVVESGSLLSYSN